MGKLPRSVILIIDNTNLGGAELVALEFLRELNKLGIICYLITSVKGGIFEEFKKETRNQLILPFPYPSKVVSWIHYICFKRKVGKFIRNIERDRLILVGDYYPLWAALLVKESTKTPVYSIWQGEYVFEDDSCLKKWIRYGANRADKLIASYPLAEHLNKQEKLNKKVFPLNPRTDISPFNKSFYDRNVIREKLGFKSKEKIAICVGRVGKRKGQMWLVEAFLKNERLYKDWHLMIVGPINDDEKGYWEDLKAQDFSNKLHFLGLRRDIPELLSTADLGIFPGTFNESFGLAVVEAMMMDLPILALRSGTIPYNLGENYSGLFNKEDKESLIKRWECLDDKGLEDLRKQIDKDSVGQKLSHERWLGDLKAVFGEV